jgi:carbonic anhydrase
MLDIENMLIKGNLRFHLKITQDETNIEPIDKLPRYPILILTCMDPRIDVHRIFQLDPGDVFVLRNAGNLCSQDSLRSILLAIYQYDIKYIIVLGHLDCGMTKINLLELKKRVSYVNIPYKSKNTLDLFTEVKEFFKPFSDELKNIGQQIETLQKLQEQKKDVKILGMLYDVETGWVLEYNRFKGFASTEDFREQYINVLKEKQYQFINFIKTIEHEITIAENLEKIKLEKESEDARENYIKSVVNKKDKDSVGSQNQTLSAPTILAKVTVPKIIFPGVKIHIPKIYRKRNDVKDKT